MKRIFILIILALVIGCDNQNSTGGEEEQPSNTIVPKERVETVETPKPSPTVTPTIQTETSTPSTLPSPTVSVQPTEVINSNKTLPDVDKVITGTYIYPWSNPLNSGTAEVTKISTNKYHLNVSVVHGFGHNIGEIDSDFTYDGKNFVLLNDQYKIVTISFTDYTLTIDYPGEGFGGAGAEPKGTFYLKNSGVDDAPFLRTLYEKLKLRDQYRHGFTDVLTYNINKTQKVLLVRSKGSINRTQIVAESLVLYDTSNQIFDVLGEVNSHKSQEILKKLESLKASPELIYQLLHKDYADRFIELEMKRFDNGDRTVGEPDKFKLTDAEAFYIVTGIEGATSTSNNKRNSDNIGSIFKTEVDHSDNKTVTIHIYEIVRNDKDDEHTATADWLELDRSTGEVSSMIFDK
ncbi:hypothetical protein A8709_20025 [Paenibacillus pectinilyticus]|uniref:Lipoprotein n=1 Tax=Paenibacillus pectinilyticus TaxID=512399 RepID=A0A1C1A0F5_9BACL|nr:hypothetical protein [Paenibacillus pectinilyticus]OCT13863.1 hypothetical protein A8709_20025 [Paenibacillus pectinilyticus]